MEQDDMDSDNDINEEQIEVQFQSETGRKICLKLNQKLHSFKMN
jgi:hypothetical protein